MPVPLSPQLLFPDHSSGFCPVSGPWRLCILCLPHPDACQNPLVKKDGSAPTPPTFHTLGSVPAIVTSHPSSAPAPHRPSIPCPLLLDVLPQPKSKPPAHATPSLCPIVTISWLPPPRGSGGQGQASALSKIVSLKYFLLHRIYLDPFQCHVGTRPRSVPHFYQILNIRKELSLKDVSFPI